MCIDEIEEPENSKTGHDGSDHEGWTPLASEEPFGLHGGCDFHAGVGRELRETCVDL